jgi:hypothetical protein
MASTINASTSAGGGIIQTADASGQLALQGAGTTVATATSTGFQVNTYSPATSLITSGTAVTPSTTVVDFTGIPSWVKRITILLNGVVASSTSNYLVQIGSGTFTTTGYAGFVFLGTTARSAFSTGFMITGLRAATSSVNGSIVLSLVSGNSWNETGITSDGDASVLGSSQSSGNLTLGGVLDRVRVTSVSANTFSAGTINIMYE